MALWLKGEYSLGHNGSLILGMKHVQPSFTCIISFNPHSHLLM